MQFDFPQEDGNEVHHSDRARWTEESFLDIPSRDSDGSAHFLGRFLGSRSVRFLFVCIMVAMGLFLARVAYLQIRSGEEFATIADQNRLRIETERASRGFILDELGRPIVKNVPEFILTLVVHDLPSNEVERQKEVQYVADLLHEPPLAITESISSMPRHPLLIRQAQTFREDIAYESALRFMVEERHVPGFQITVRERRSYFTEYEENGTVYPMPQSIAHVVGYLGKIDEQEWETRRREGYLLSDLVGRQGVEKTYDQQLHGVHGKTYTEIDALGQERVVVRREAPVPGTTLSLTIDLRLQRIMEDRMVAAMKALPKRTRAGAVGIALDPRSGAVRALVSLPSYDPRLFSSSRSSDAIAAILQDPQQPLFPRAVAGEYPSGSTIKPVIALAALEEGVITPSTTVLSVGGIRISQWFFPDWLAGGHGITDVKKAIADSVNTFFYTIGGGFGSIQGLGIDRMSTWLSTFRIGSKLGIDVPREATGFVPTPAWKKEVKNEQWYIGDTYHLAIGQGDLLVTPLQIASMTATFANGGTLWRPHVVSLETPEALIQQIGSNKHIQVIRQGMRQGVTSGSSRRLSLLPFTAAGKTGTAQWSSQHPPHAWFTGWAPYENPELAITILIEEGEEGSSVAAPIAYEVLRDYYATNPFASIDKK